MRPRSAKPPTTPPTIAPTFGEDFAPCETEDPTDTCVEEGAADDWEKVVAEKGGRVEPLTEDSTFVTSNVPSVKGTELTHLGRVLDLEKSCGDSLGLLQRPLHEENDGGPGTDSGVGYWHE